MNTKQKKIYCCVFSINTILGIIGMLMIKSNTGRLSSIGFSGYCLVLLSLLVLLVSIVFFATQWFSNKRKNKKK